VVKTTFIMKLSWSLDSNYADSYFKAIIKRTNLSVCESIEIEKIIVSCP